MAAAGVAGVLRDANVLNNNPAIAKVWAMFLTILKIDDAFVGVILCIQ